MTLAQAIKAAAITLDKHEKVGIRKNGVGPRKWQFTPYPECFQEETWYIFRRMGKKQETEERIRRFFKDIGTEDTKYFKK